MTLAPAVQTKAQHKIHPKLPNGFSYADRMQTEQYHTYEGIIFGARKVIFVDNGEGGYDIAVQMHPPKSVRGLKRRPLIRRALQEAGISDDQAIAWYIAEYNRGWEGARRENCREWQDGSGSHAFDDGYLDRAAGRPKWHLAHCANHDECGEG
jgi:hypothetical protein